MLFWALDTISISTCQMDLGIFGDYKPTGYSFTVPVTIGVIAGIPFVDRLFIPAVEKVFKKEVTTKVKVGCGFFMICSAYNE